MDAMETDTDWDQDPVSQKRQSTGSLLSEYSIVSKKPRLSTESSLDSSLETSREDDVFSIRDSRESSCSTISPSPAPAHSPKNLLDLDDESFKTIIEYAIPSCNQNVEPWYRQGVLVKGIYSTGLDQDDELQENSHLITIDNVDLTFFLTCKSIYDLASQHYYNTSRFLFDDATACRFWMKHIGAEFAKVRNLYLRLGTGFYRPRTCIDPIGLSEEELWHSNLCWMRTRHDFDELTIIFTGWNDIDGLDKVHTASQNAQMRIYRERSMEELKRYRGIPKVRIGETNCFFLPKHDRGQLSLMMGQRRDKSQENIKVKKPGLFALMLLMDKTRGSKADYGGDGMTSI